MHASARPSSLRLFAVVLAAAASLRCGTGLFYAEVEEQELCKVAADNPMFADPSGRPNTFSVAFDYNAGAELKAFTGPKLDTVARISSVTLAARGLPDMAFIESGELDIGGASGADGGTSQLPNQVLLQYKKNPGVNPGPEITLTNPTGKLVDLTRYMTNGAMHLSVSLKGSFPNKDWSMSVKTCVYLKARYRYL